MQSNYTVVLKVFSGRENPTWQLPEALLPTLLHKLHTAKPLATPQKINEGLGYTGFILQNEHNEWHIFNSLISTVEKSTPNFFEDRNRQLEKILLASTPNDWLAFIPSLQDE